MRAATLIGSRRIPIWRRELDRVVNHLIYSDDGVEYDTPAPECPGIAFLTPDSRVITISGFPTDKWKFPGGMGKFLVGPVATNIKNIELGGPQWDGNVCRVRGVTLIGFADDLRGPNSQPNYNNELSRKRANTVRTLLKDAIKEKSPGLENQICIRTWSGGSVPLSAGPKTAAQIREERSGNRKVEILFHLLCTKSI